MLYLDSICLIITVLNLVCFISGSLYGHMRKHTGQLFKCPVCDYDAIHRAALLSHINNHRSFRHICELCNKQYCQIDQLRGHVRFKHKNTESGLEYLKRLSASNAQSNGYILFKCNFCEMLFISKGEFERHVACHNTDGLHKCHLCSRTFADKRHLRRHYRTHRIIFVCADCDFMCRSSINLRQHIESIHSDSEELYERSLGCSFCQPDNEIALFFKDNGMPVAYETSLSQMSSELSLKASVSSLLPFISDYKRMSLQVLNAIEQVYGNIECGECGKHFHDNKSYEAHIIVHTDPGKLLSYITQSS